MSADRRPKSYYAKPARDGTDGWLVEQHQVGTVCYCFDDSGSEAKKIAALLNVAQAVSDGSYNSQWND